jgi:hypothetical protein
VVPGHRRHLLGRRPIGGLQPARPGLLPRPALLLPVAAVLRDPRLQVGGQRQDLDPGLRAARAASNIDYTTGAVDDSILNDKEYIAVDNTPTSPHYGRLYVTYTKFHLLADGSSDYCPIQLAYTDSVPTSDPSLAVFQHTAAVPDAPGAGGLGESANQGSVPQVEANGALDITYSIEECNTAIDHGFRFQKSTNGGASFLPSPVHIDKPGQFVDNPDPGDLLPPTHFRVPNNASIDYNRATGTLTFVYQNNVNRAVSGADISYQQSRDGGFHWTDARFLSTRGALRPATTSSSPGSTRTRPARCRPSGSTGAATRPTAGSTPGRRP